MTPKLFSKNFTLLILGQVSSLFGNIMLKFALSMYVLEVTGSAAIFASILAAATIPTILLSPLGGILADRANRRNIMVALDLLTGLAILCAALALTHGHTLIIISTLLVVLSILGAFETPTVQAAIPQMQCGENIIKGNAVVNQVAALATLVAPLIGSALYIALGLQIVLAASMLCFFCTAALECFIRLDFTPYDCQEGLGRMIKNDFLVSMRFLFLEQPGISKLLLLVALVSFFITGTAIVGLPYLIRNILGLSAAHYGAAESALAVAAIVGSLAAGVLTRRLLTRQLALVLAALGACLLPAGLAFLLPAGPLTRYGIILIAFCGMQCAAIIFSVFALSAIQQRTPNHLMGKVMAYTAAITMCLQPLGQLAYGFLFDSLRDALYLVLIPSGLIICLIGLLSTGFFRSLEENESPASVQAMEP